MYITRISVLQRRVKIVQCLSTTLTKIHSARAKVYVPEKKTPNRRPKCGKLSEGDVLLVGVALENSRSHVLVPVTENYCKAHVPM